MSKQLHILKKENLKSLLEEMMKKSKVYIPAQDNKNSIFNFFDLEEIIPDLSFDKNTDKRYGLNFTEKTKMSPKFIIYPQYEKLIDFSFEKNLEKLEDVKINLDDLSETKNSIIFGLKSCDVQAISRMDHVFAEGIVKDPYYMSKRENTLLISIGCDAVFDDCFCSMVGGNPYGFNNTDIGLMETEDGFAVMFLSDKGQKTIEEYNNYFSGLSKKESENFNIKMAEKNKESTEKIESLWPDIKHDEIPGILNNSFNIGVWKKVSEKCIGCGACTFVCPTCYCFDIKDEQDGMAGERYRCWDFCTSFLYTLEASGHNPRNDINKRYKNKINCKYNYNYARHGDLYCVGCGRCIEVCPADMDIREIVQTVLKNSDK
ncbi:MAG: 4Fe-4S dicluster domain-containing protein [Candidatus Humimicrobiaceae bacterium]